MSSIVLNVSLNNVGKKVSVTKSTTVNQLVQEALKKFGLDAGEYPKAMVYSNGKKIDNLLPIRLTNLINNSKLKLETGPKGDSAGTPKVISLKCIINETNGGSSTKIIKIDNGKTVLDLVNELDAGLLEYDAGVYDLVVVVMDYKLSQSKNELGVKLNSLLGDVSSLVVRIGFAQRDNSDLVKEQQKIVGMQLEQQRKRQALEAERDAQREVERKAAQAERDNKRVEEEADRNEKVEGERKEKVEGERKEKVEGEADRKEKFERERKEKAEREERKATPKDSVRPVIAQREANAASTTPQLFKASNRSKTYENPDEDYEMTIGQAQKYQQIIANSAKPKKTKQIKSLPEAYTIRVKFPNQSILQFHFENGETIKFGQILKKIDELLLSKFINNYTLKLGYPPFTRLGQTFKDNSTKLHDMSDFQINSQITLIWEYNQPIDSSAQFLKEDQLTISDSSHLPEMVLENNRANLDDEAETPPPTGNPNKITNQVKKDAKGNKLPKWFRVK
ncbi:hypothetical protein QCA50_015811 [Cerrena zonata]|uniref:TUG ubiquitin-like domain-containing protein n=1 Tax=Cerrena zonata TaxID=2478898 RepID=A0AAW0FIF0_9APHY